MPDPSDETTLPPANVKPGALPRAAPAKPSAAAPPPPAAAAPATQGTAPAAQTPPPPPPSIERLGTGAGFVPLIEKVLRDSSLLAQFDAQDLPRFAGFLQIYRVSSGIPFIVEGDPGDFMVLVLEGFVEVFKKGAEGERSLVGVAAPGKTLGEMSLIDGEPRFATCIAATPVTFAALPKKGLERIMKDHPELGQKILLQLVLLLNQRLRHVSAQLLQVWQQQS
jgi:CRP/FNR family transcriptional regulator, cyclic AMP receptor protein